MQKEQRIIRRRKCFKVARDPKRDRIVHPALHARDELLVPINPKHLLDTLRTNQTPIHDAQPPIIGPKPPRQTMRPILDVVKLRLQPRERPIDHASPRIAHRDIPLRIAIAPEPRARIEDRRVREIVPVERPVPVDQLAAVPASIPQRVVVDLEEVAVPGEEGGGVVSRVADVGVNPGEVFVEGAVGVIGQGGVDGAEALDGLDVMVLFGWCEGTPFEAEGAAGRGLCGLWEGSDHYC